MEYQKPSVLPEGSGVGLGVGRQRTRVLPALVQHSVHLLVEFFEGVSQVAELLLLALPFAQQLPHFLGEFAAVVPFEFLHAHLHLLAVQADHIRLLAFPTVEVPDLFPAHHHQHDHPQTEVVVPDVVDGVERLVC